MSRVIDVADHALQGFPAVQDSDRFSDHHGVLPVVRHDGAGLRNAGEAAQAVDQLGGQPAAELPVRRFLKEGACHRLEFFGKTLLWFGKIDPGAKDNVVNIPGFKVGGRLGENAADFFILYVEVVDPFNLRLQACHVRDGLADQNTGGNGDEKGLADGRAGPQDHAQINPGAAGREKGAPHAPASAGLGLRDDDCAVRRPGQGPLLAKAVGGVKGRVDLQTLRLRRVLQPGCDGSSGENIVAFTQRVALPGFGLDLVALISEGLDGLPDSTPGEVQLFCQRFAGHRVAPVFLQYF